MSQIMHSDSYALFAIYIYSQALIDSQQEFAEIEHEARRIMAEFNVQKSKMRELKDLAEQRAPIMDENKNPLPLKDELEALPVSTIPEIEAAMDEASAKVNGIAANPDVLRQYEERKKEIELIRAQLEELTDSTDSKVHDLAKKKGPWEQALQNAVSQVNELFAGYMSDLGCAGKLRASFSRFVANIARLSHPVSVFCALATRR